MHWIHAGLSFEISGDWVFQNLLYHTAVWPGGQFNAQNRTTVVIAPIQSTSWVQVHCENGDAVLCSIVFLTPAGYCPLAGPFFPHQQSQQSNRINWPTNARHCTCTPTCKLRAHSGCNFAAVVWHYGGFATYIFWVLRKQNTLWVFKKSLRIGFHSGNTAVQAGKKDWFEAIF